MLTLELTTTDDPIVDYATLKIRSGIDNKFFDYNIKNLDDQEMLVHLLDKTSKSFYGLEKAFVSFLETGEARFNITKNRVDWIDNKDNDVKGKPSNYTIKCKVDFVVGTSYLGFYRLANNEITAIKNYIKSSNLYAQGIKTKFAQNSVKDSVKNLENVILNMEESLSKSDEKLDQVYNDFKSQLVEVFMKAVSVRSNNLINPDTLRDRINTNLTNVSTGEVKDGFYEKLDQSRKNFINMNKEIIDSLLSNNKTENESSIGTSEGPSTTEFFKKSTESIHQNLRNTIIVNEKNEAYDVEEPLDTKREIQEIDPKEFFKTEDMFKKIFNESDDLDKDFSEEKED